MINDSQKYRLSIQIDRPVKQRIIANQEVTMYFMQSKKYHEVRKKLKTQKNFEIELDLTYDGNFYRTYTYMDLLNLSQIRDQIANEENYFVEEEAMVSVYSGHTFFSIFAYSIFAKGNQFQETIFKQLSTRNLKEEVDLDNNG